MKDLRNILFLTVFTTFLALIVSCGGNKSDNERNKYDDTEDVADYKGQDEDTDFDSYEADDFKEGSDEDDAIEERYLTGLDLIRAKLDTLEATVMVLKSYDTPIDKYYRVANIHLRIAKELHYYIAVYERAANPTPEEAKFRDLTDGWSGGHLYNENWVSKYISYNESLDYEYTDVVFPFDESNPLPTAVVSQAEDISNKF